MKKFLVKHSGFVTVIGGVIVFVTFMVHEGLQEHLRALVDSIDSAENNFLLRDEIADYGSRSDGRDLFAAKEELQPAQRYFEGANGNISLVRFELENISRLETGLSSNEGDEKETEKLKQDLSAVTRIQSQENEKFFDSEPLDEDTEFRATSDSLELRMSCEDLARRLLHDWDANYGSHSSRSGAAFG